jgi:hypothetical protein
MRTPIHWLSGLLAGGIVIGCGSGTPAVAGTGATECVQAYFEALIQRDDARAYAVLDPLSQRKCNLRQFSELAAKYRSSLGFDPERVYVRGCEERDNEATAHVVLAGERTSQHRRFKDGLTLRRGNDGWRVVLPTNFGRTKKR